MDGKLLILCDEDPRDEERLTIRDKNFFASEMWDPDDNTDILFVSFDALIPEDRTFIEQCKLYGSFRANPELGFMLKQKGKTNPKYGTIHGSIQEQSYLNTYLDNLERLRIVHNEGGDVQAEMLEMACQYQFAANANFLRDFSDILSKYGVVRILPAFKKGGDKAFTQYRMALLSAWDEQNKIMGKNKVYASLLDPMEYTEFKEVYGKSIDEMMKVMSLPIFGEEDNTPKL